MSTFSSSVPTYLYATLLSGQYDIPQIYCEVDAVYTNTVPVDAYRGAGRPEATFVVERLVEVGAREMGQDPAELRRKNFVKTFPHQTPVIMAYDAGDYDASLKKAMELADYKGFAKRKRESARHGKLRGIGFSTYIEACGIAPSQAVGSLGAGVGLWESAEVRVNPTGSVEVLTGSSRPRPGPRDDLRAARVRPAWHSDRQRLDGARRYRQGAVRHGHLRLALGRRRHVGDRQGARQGRGQGQEGRRASARSGRRRHRVQGRQIQRRRHRQVGGVGRRLAQRLCRAQILRPGARARPEGRRVLRSDQFHLPGRLPHLRGRDRSRDRQHRDRRLDGGRRFRRGDQSDDRRGPGPRRHRAGRRPGVVRGRDLRQGRPARHRLVHGLCHAAGRLFPVADSRRRR